MEIWRAPARHLSGPAGSEPDVRPLAPPEAYRLGSPEKLSVLSGHQVLHIQRSVHTASYEDTRKWDYFNPLAM
jgi:hypothetical protein